MTERVKPDHRQHTIKLGGKVLVEGSAFFLRSTILRVIDEVFTKARHEYGPAPDALSSAVDHYREGTHDALNDLHRALRARFEEGDD